MSHTCPVCQTAATSPWCCGIDLTAAAPWRMTPERIRAVHVLAMTTKGLDEETYRLRLGAVGVESCKQFTREQYHTFMGALRDLPDAAHRSPST